MSPFLGPQPWEAPDPLPVMRRELKLLLIEMNLLRIEVEQSRSIREEAQCDRLAVPARELLAHGLDHLPLLGNHLQRLGDVLAELRQLPRAAARTAPGAAITTRSRGR